MRCLYLIQLLFVSLYIFCTTSGATGAEKRKMYLALDDGEYSKMLKSELERDWLKFNGPKTAENIVKCKILNELSKKIHNKFDIIYSNTYDIPIGTKFPSIKFKTYNKFLEYDKLAFRQTTFPLYTTQYMIDLYYNQEYSKIFEDTHNKYVEEYQKKKEARENQFIKDLEDSQGHIEGAEYSFYYKCVAAYGYNGKCWQKIYELGNGQFDSYEEATDRIDKITINKLQFEEIDRIDGFIYEISARIPIPVTKKRDGKIVKDIFHIYTKIGMPWGIDRDISFNEPFSLPSSLRVNGELVVQPTPPWEPSYQFVAPDRVFKPIKFMKINETKARKGLRWIMGL